MWTLSRSLRVVGLLPLVAAAVLIVAPAHAALTISGTGSAEVICVMNVSGSTKFCIDGGTSQFPSGTAGTLTINAGAGDDTVILYDGTCTCTCSGVTTPQNVAFPIDDVIVNGEGGNDFLYGSNDDDDDITWNGGTEADHIETGDSAAGTDTINGGTGDDDFFKYDAGSAPIFNGDGGTDTVSLGAGLCLEGIAWASIEHSDCGWCGGCWLCGCWDGDGTAQECPL